MVVFICNNAQTIILNSSFIERTEFIDLTTRLMILVLGGVFPLR